MLSPLYLQGYICPYNVPPPLMLCFVSSTMNFAKGGVGGSHSTFYHPKTHWTIIKLPSVPDGQNSTAKGCFCPYESNYEVHIIVMWLLILKGLLNRDGPLITAVTQTATWGSTWPTTSHNASATKATSSASCALIHYGRKLMPTQEEHLSSTHKIKGLFSFTGELVPAKVFVPTPFSIYLPVACQIQHLINCGYNIIHRKQE